MRTRCCSGVQTCGKVCDVKAWATESAGLIGLFATDSVSVFAFRSAVASLLRGWHCERLRFSVATAATFSKRDAAETLLYASGSPGGRVEQRSLHAAELSRCLLSFGGRRSLLELLQLPDAQRVYVLLVSEGGRVEWAESGNCSTEKATELRRVLQLTPDCQPSLPKIQQVPRSVEA